MTVRRTRLLLGAILVLAALVRWLHWQFLENDPLYQTPLLDEDYFYYLARKTAAGEPMDLPFWRPPGLVWALAGIMKVCGPGAFWPRVVQLALATLTAGLTFQLGRRHFGIQAGLAAALVVGLHGVLIDYSPALKAATWVCFLDMLALVLLSAARDRRSLPGCFAGGAILGLSALFRPMILGYAPLAAMGMLAGRRRRGLGAAGLVLLGAILPVLPVVAANSRAAGRPVFISTNGGINFFIGNNSNYPETVTARPGGQWDSLILEPALEAGLTHPGPERDRFYYGLGREFWGDHPLHAAGLYARKFYLFFNGREVPRDTDITVRREASPLLRLLAGEGVVGFPNGLMIPLALMGLAACLRFAGRTYFLWSFLICQAVLVPVFFMASRYRAPSLPVLAVLAAAGTMALLETLGPGLRARGLRQWGAFAVLVVVLNFTTFETRQSLRGESHYFRGNILVQRGDFAAGTREYRLAAEQDPLDSRPWETMGRLLSQSGKHAEAQTAWDKAVELNPRSLTNRDMLVQAAVAAHDTAGAIDRLEENLEAFPDYPRGLATWNFHAAVLCFRSGAYERAARFWAEAARVQPDRWEELWRAWSNRIKKDEIPPEILPGESLNE